MGFSDLQITVFCFHLCFAQKKEKKKKRSKYLSPFVSMVTMVVILSDYVFRIDSFPDFILKAPTGSYRLQFFLITLLQARS